MFKIYSNKDLPKDIRGVWVTLSRKSLLYQSTRVYSFKVMVVEDSTLDNSDLDY